MQLSFGDSQSSINKSNNFLTAICLLHLHNHFLSGDQSKWKRNLCKESPTKFPQSPEDGEECQVKAYPRLHVSCSDFEVKQLVQTIMEDEWSVNKSLTPAPLSFGKKTSRTDNFQQHESNTTISWVIRSGLCVPYRRKMPLMFGVPSNAEAGTLEMRLLCR